MCRFLAWKGRQRYLDELIFEQEQSLVEQSKNALIGKTSINADGFGLAWYQGRETPCVYNCLLYTSPSPRDVEESRMPSSA